MRKETRAKAELIRNYRAKRLLTQAMELLAPAPEDKYLEVEGLSGDAPGEVTINVQYYDCPPDEEEDEENSL